MILDEQQTWFNERNKVGFTSMRKTLIVDPKSGFASLYDILVEVHVLSWIVALDNLSLSHDSSDTIVLCIRFDWIRLSAPDEPKVRGALITKPFFRENSIIT